MVSKTVTVINSDGIHMRPAGMISKTATSFVNCNISLNSNGKSINAKTLMQIMASCLKKGNEVEIVCDGENEEAALSEISSLFESGFGE
jgi:phosphocarrier protein